MPSFRQYNDAELDSLVLYLSTFDYKLDSNTAEYVVKYVLSVLTLTISFNGLATLSQEEFDQSQAVYDTYCLSCHGENMDGNGEVAELRNPIRVISRNISSSLPIKIDLKTRY